MPRTVIAVDLDTMRELADEETRVRSEKTDWSNVAYREEAVRLLEVTEKNTIGYDRALTIVSEWMNHPANRDRLPKANR